MSQPINITIASPTFGKFGGIESFIFALADILAASPQIASVTVCLKRIRNCSIDPFMQRTMDESKAECVVVEPWSKELFRCVSRADLVHGQNAVFDIALFSRLAGVPLVQTIHNWRRTGLKPQFISRGVAYALARRHWYNSDFVWDSWEPKGRRSTSGKPPLLSNLPTGSVPPSERHGFIFVSRWIPRKGLETLLDAYAAANLNREAWPLTLVGDGPLRADIEKRLAAKPIPGVFIRGHVDVETRNDLIRRARWMVTPPNTREDLGLTPIEARHVGVPCIITRDGGLPEAGGKHALICEPGDAGGLRELLERASRMSENEYARISSETQQELLRSLKPLAVYPEIYREVLYGPDRFGNPACIKSY